MEKIAVSACLLGINTKYNGSNNLNKEVLDYIKGKTVFPICPEVFGGLTIPRNPSEALNDKIYSNAGVDVTEEFTLGKNKTIDFLKRNNVTTIILKNGSPSCGFKSYDGTFRNIKIDKMGLTARCLFELGFTLIYFD